MCKSMQELDKKFYKIGDVSDILGIPESTLRYWETQFTIIKPKRNKKNIRYYTPHDIEIISRVYYLVKEKGLKLDAAQAQIRHNRDGVDKRFDAIEQLKGIRAQLVAFQESLDTLFPDIPAAR
ncbi:MAG: MerR family transcriptional regulator [Muribaculaceae bacterium]|nr:MerR family transcriptional regulator [Muribaculaceae bacterium]